MPEELTAIVKDKIVFMDDFDNNLHHTHGLRSEAMNDHLNINYPVYYLVTFIVFTVIVLNLLSNFDVNIRICNLLGVESTL